MSLPFRKNPQAMVHEPEPEKPERIPEPPVTAVSLERSWGQFGISAAGLTVILAVCWYLAGMLIGQTNLHLGIKTDPVTGEAVQDQDQKHNIGQALLVRDDPAAAGRAAASWSESLRLSMPYRTDGVIAPLWPWVASRLAPEEAEYSADTAAVTPEDREFFIRGKWANVTLVLVFLWFLGLVMARSFRPAAVVTVLLLGAFGALLPRAVYFQPEPLYFVFFFLSWVCAVRLLIQNDLWLHPLFGLLGGIAYLAKTSVEPLLVAWFGVSALRFLAGLLRGEALLEEYRWTCRNHFFGLIMFAVGWMMVVGPRYSFAQEKWGDARFSYPAVWMWFDTFEPGLEWARAHPDRAALEKIPAGEMPSAALYARTHTRQEITDRLVNGTWAKVSGFLAPKIVRPPKKKDFEGWRALLDQRGIYLGAVAAVFLGVAVLMWSRRRAVDRMGLSLPGGAGPAVLFVTGTALGYSLLYGWYHPIGRGERFMLALYLPLVFSLIQGAEHLLDLALMRRAPRWTGRVYEGALWILNAAIAWRLAEVLRNPVFRPDVM